MQRVIPRLIHQVWLGGAPPACDRAWRDTWRRHHPSWRYILWTEETLPPLANQALFEHVDIPAQRVDIARYELLYRYGGIYADTDCECRKPFDALAACVSGFVGEERPGYYGNAVLGFSRHHSFLRSVVDSLPDSWRDGADILAQTGPGLLTRLLDSGRPNVVVFPSAYFYPYSCKEPWRRDEPFPDAYAVHHWTLSWRTNA